MFDFREDDYDDTGYDNSYYSTNRPSTYRLASTALPGGRRTTQEVQERDFTQIILGWRLKTVRESDVYIGSGSLPLRSVSIPNYYDQFLPLILEDARESVVQGLNKKGASFFVTIKVDAKQPRDPANPWSITFEGRIPENQDHSASMNVLVLSHRSGKEQDMVMLVLASELSDRNEIKVKFILDPRHVSANLSIFRAGSRWQATYVTSLTSHQRMYEACIRKVRPDFLMDTVLGRVATPVDRYDEKLIKFTQGLNTSQQRAIQSFIATPEGIVLLQGPPGTGKTTTIVQMLAALVSKGQRVLVSAPSNKAVQVLAERFVQKYNAPVILAGIDSKLSPALRPIFLHTWLSDSCSLLSEYPLRAASKKSKQDFLQALAQISKNIDSYKKRISTYYYELNDELFLNLAECLSALERKAGAFDFSQDHALRLFQAHINPRLEQYMRLKDRILSDLPPKEAIETTLLNRSKIIFSTLSVAGRQQMLATDIQPVDVLIVDEAGQSIEAETLIAFQHSPRKVLLVGDTKQLPATVLSERAKQHGFDRSMMERLEQNNVSQLRPQLRLDTQYRMHAEISRWPSDQYYAGRLITHNSVSAHVNRGLTQAVAFYDISSGKELSSRTSRQNNIEANYVIDLIRKLRETDKTSRIGVITFYAAQLDALQDLLEREASPIKQKVTINTVDGFQGDERDIIILSCVCANGRTIGFLDDARRLNVSITRAKETLIILGHARTLESSDSDMKLMVADLRGRNKYFTQQHLDEFLGKLPAQKPGPQKIGKAMTRSASASVADLSSSMSTLSHGVFGQKEKQLAASAAVSEAVPKSQGKKQPLCRFFNAEPSACRNGDSCSFAHTSKR